MRLLRAITQSTALEFIGQILLLLLFPLVGSIAVGWWGVVEESWSPLALTLAIVVFTALVVLSVTIYTFRAKLQHSPSSWGANRLSRVLREWAFDFGNFGVYPNAVRQQQPDASFAFDVRDEQGRGVTVALIGKHLDLSARIGLDAQSQSKLDTLEQNEENDLRRELGMELTKYGVGFDFRNLSRAMQNEQRVVALQDRLYS